MLFHTTPRARDRASLPLLHAPIQVRSINIYIYIYQIRLDWGQMLILGSGGKGREAFLREISGPHGTCMVAEPFPACFLDSWQESREKRKKGKQTNKQTNKTDCMMVEEERACMWSRHAFFWQVVCVSVCVYGCVVDCGASRWECVLSDLGFSSLLLFLFPKV